MCAYNIKPDNTPKDKVRYGYKVFYERLGDFYPECVNRTFKIPRNRWLKAKKSWVYVSDSGTSYRAGFHIFATKAGAECWSDTEFHFVVKRVKFRGSRLVGDQHGLEVFIADEMFVP